MARDKMILRWGTEYNPEKRAGQPKNMRDGRRLLHVWYTYEFFKSYVSDETLERLKRDRVVGGTRKNQSVLVERPRYVYYSDGMFYRPASRKNAQRSGDCYELVPLSGTIWSCYPKYQARYGLPDAEIVCIDGYPVSVRVGQDAFDVTTGSWPVMESFLGLDESYKPERYRPNKAA